MNILEELETWFTHSEFEEISKFFRERKLDIIIDKEFKRRDDVIEELEAEISNLEDEIGYLEDETIELKKDIKTLKELESVNVKATINLNKE